MNLQAQLRLTSQKLGQLQQQKDTGAGILRREVANHLNHGNVGLARPLAQTLIRCVFV